MRGIPEFRIFVYLRFRSLDTSDEQGRSRQDINQRNSIRKTDHETERRHAEALHEPEATIVESLLTSLESSTTASAKKKQLVDELRAR
ncbi:hypothetical protein HPB50_018977 [Hyalomma asiaticum]|uniref:Uncharacterized protein n=1 Tax=Hyalomma asiaticum TaxID=266040 RepID=A0ACB7RPB9_HYAAI|nr:hypothetical protein HPB50_018977 [Hyalomma asiaticum]